MLFSPKAHGHVINHILGYSIQIGLKKFNQSGHFYRHISLKYTLDKYSKSDICFTRMLKRVHSSEPRTDLETPLFTMQRVKDVLR